jgi:hypothetical protein
MTWSGGKEDSAARSRMLLASASSVELAEAMRDGVLACDTVSLRGASSSANRSRRLRLISFQ